MEYNKRQDSLLNGIIAGVAVPIISFFVVMGIGKLLAAFFISNWSGFSLRFLCIIAIVSNLIPFQIFMRQYRNASMRGTVVVTMVLLITFLLYFWRYFVG